MVDSTFIACHQPSAFISQPLPGIILLLLGVVALRRPDAAKSVVPPAWDDVGVKVHDGLGSNLTVRLNHVQALRLDRSLDRMGQANRHLGDVTSDRWLELPNVCRVASRDHQSMTERRGLKWEEGNHLVIPKDLADIGIRPGSDLAKWAVRNACRHSWSRSTGSP